MVSSLQPQVRSPEGQFKLPQASSITCAASLFCPIDRPTALTPNPQFRKTKCLTILGSTRDECLEPRAYSQQPLGTGQPLKEKRPLEQSCLKVLETTPVVAGIQTYCSLSHCSPESLSVFSFSWVTGDRTVPFPGFCHRFSEVSLGWKTGPHTSRVNLTLLLSFTHQGLRSQAVEENNSESIKVLCHRWVGLW